MMCQDHNWLCFQAQKRGLRLAVVSQSRLKTLGVERKSWDQSVERIWIAFLSSANLLWGQRVDFKDSRTCRQPAGSSLKVKRLKRTTDRFSSLVQCLHLTNTLGNTGTSSLYLASKARYPVKQNQTLHREPTDALPSDDVPKEL